MALYVVLYEAVKVTIRFSSANGSDLNICVSVFFLLIFVTLNPIISSVRRIKCMAAFSKSFFLIGGVLTADSDDKNAKHKDKVEVWSRLWRKMFGCWFGKVSPF